MARKRTWTDDDLRAAVAGSSSYKQTCQALGIPIGGKTYQSLYDRIEALGIDARHLEGRPSQRRAPWTDDELRAAIASSLSYEQTCRALGIDADEKSQKAVQQRAWTLGIDTRHFPVRHRGDTRRVGWSDEQLRDAVAKASSLAQAIRVLGLIPAGGNYRQVKRRIDQLALDTAHFLGQGWSRGRTLRRASLPLAELLVAGRHTGSHSLKQRLIAEGLKTAACERCGWAERSPDGRVPVELDHINGDHDDNRLENLRILCPNCHSLQPTHRGSNQKRRKRAVGGT